MPESLRAKRKSLVSAVASAESFGSALTSGPYEQTNDRASLDALKKLTDDF